MLTLLLLVLFGGLVAFFANQNTDGVTLYFNNLMLPNIPLYLVVLGSMLIGILLSGIVSLVNGVANIFTLFGKNRTIEARERSLQDYKERVHNLEVENQKLRQENHDVPLTTKIKDQFPAVSS